MQPEVALFDGLTLAVLDRYLAYESTFTGSGGARLWVVVQFECPRRAFVERIFQTVPLPTADTAVAHNAVNEKGRRNSLTDGV